MASGSTHVADFVVSTSHFGKIPSAEAASRALMLWAWLVFLVIVVFSREQLADKLGVTPCLLTD